MKVLVIEDSSSMLTLLKQGLQSHSIVVDTAADGEEGIKLALFMVYDVVILDLGLPKAEGFAVAQRIKEKKRDLPIVVLSGDTRLEVKVQLLGICDDFIVKPCPLEELVARLYAVHKRGKVMYPAILEVDDLRLDPNAHKVTRGGKEIALRNKEFALLMYLMQHKGQVVSRTMMLENVWDMNVDPFTNTVDVHIRNLRERIDRRFAKKLITCIPKRGYKIDG